MNEFINIDILNSVAGCSLIITMLTEIFKRYLPESIDTKWLALTFSVIIGTIRIIYIGAFDFASIVSGVFSIIGLLAGAIGTYEIIQPVASDMKSMIIGGATDEQNEQEEE